jgi:GDP-4-dehydro-6-deoxy-D-mannose reductase
MRVLVTGGTGFLGALLARSLVEAGDEVTATYRPGASPAAGAATDGIALRSVDVSDSGSVAEAFGDVRPEIVYHLAARSSVMGSWEDPVGTYRTNLMGTLHLLQAVRSKSPSTKFVFAGSGTEYGSADLIPTPEDSPLRPTSPYASSKAGADLLCYQYFRSFATPVYRCRIFATTGWGKRGDATNDFASQIAKAEHRPGPHVLQVGNLDRQRDVTDARDVVRALSTIPRRGEPGSAYNIGSGVPRSVRQTLEILLSAATVPISVETDPTRLRPGDEAVHLADNARLRALGWSPEIPFEQTLREILSGWREMEGTGPGGRTA